MPSRLNSNSKRKKKEYIYIHTHGFTSKHCSTLFITKGEQSELRICSLLACFCSHLPFTQPKSPHRKLGMQLALRGVSSESTASPLLPRMQRRTSLAIGRPKSSRENGGRKDQRKAHLTMQRDQKSARRLRLVGESSSTRALPVASRSGEPYSSCRRAPLNAPTASILSTTRQLERSF